jgi:hypothetical protein
MSEEYRCLHNDDCKNLATCDEIDGRNTSCDIHKLDENTYTKTIDFIKKAKEKHGNKYGYWKVVYTRAKDKADIFCKKCDKYFPQTPDSHRKSGCNSRICIIDKVKQTFLKNYGVECCLQNIDILKKSKQTLIDRYGVKHPMQSQVIKEKIKQTCIEKYGVDNSMKLSEVREKAKQTMNERYGIENPMQSQVIKEKIKQTCIERYGVDNSMKSSMVREKAKQTMNERYGVENPMQSQVIKEKIKQTMNERYGVEYTMMSPELKDKIKQTMNERYGVDYSMQSLEVREKSKQTSIDKYGTISPMQNPEIFEKSQKNAKKFKEYKTPSGAIWTVQGYEPYALDNLLQNYTEDLIKTERRDVPRIEYKVADKKKYYFPDIYIPHENRIIEVKSNWTYNLHLLINKHKKEATIKEGYNYEIWIYDKNKQRISNLIDTIRAICITYEILYDENETIEQLKEKLLDYHNNVAPLTNEEQDYIGYFKNNKK